LPDGFTISPMRDEEVAQLFDWAADEGWNPGVADLRIARQSDRDAFIALREPGGALAGGGSIFSYDGRFGFMGLFIMRADLRNKGIGAVLWHWRRDRLRERLAPGTAIGMDGVYDMVPFYERGGFRPAYRHLRVAGMAAHAAMDPVVVFLDKADLEEITLYDRPFFPVPRTRFLQQWSGQPGAHLAALHENGVLAGYGVARPCRVGFKIGPLFAARAEIAQRLLSTLMAKIAGHQV